jgi:hypothetical protein
MRSLILVIVCLLLMAACAEASIFFQPGLHLAQCNLPNNGGLIVWAWSNCNTKTVSGINGVAWEIDGAVQGYLDLPLPTPTWKDVHRVYIPVSGLTGRITLSCFVGGHDICTSPQPGTLIFGNGKDQSIILNANAAICTQKQLDDYYATNPPPVPELGVIAAVLAMLGAVGGIALFRRR